MKISKSLYDGITFDGYHVIGDVFGNYIVLQRLESLDGYHILMVGGDSYTSTMNEQTLKKFGDGYLTACAYHLDKYYKGQVNTSPRADYIRWLEYNGFVKATAEDPNTEFEYDYIRRGPMCDETEA